MAHGRPMGVRFVDAKECSACTHARVVAAAAAAAAEEAERMFQNPTRSNGEGIDMCVVLALQEELAGAGDTAWYLRPENAGFAARERQRNWYVVPDHPE